MRLLRSLLFVLAALLLQSCLWRPPPIPPFRTDSDSSTPGLGDSGTGPTLQDASNASDSGFAGSTDADGAAGADSGADADADDARDGAEASAQDAGDAGAGDAGASAPDAGDS